MPIASRAAIFSPFAAVAGHAEAIVEVGRLTDRRLELAEDQKLLLDRSMRIIEAHLNEQPEVSVTWFQPDQRKDGGSYITSTGRLKKIDVTERMLIMTDGLKIVLEDVIDIESPIIKPYFLD